MKTIASSFFILLLSVVFLYPVSSHAGISCALPAGVEFCLRLPQDGSTNIPVNTRLRWDFVQFGNLDHFKLKIHVPGNVWVDINVPLGDCDGEQCSVAATDFSNIFLIEQGSVTYEWRIIAENSGNTELGNSQQWTFITQQRPVLITPPGGGGTIPIVNSGNLNPISAKNLTELFNKIFSFLFGLSIFLVPVFVIYAAFLMLMGGGDPVKLQKGRMILLWTAVAFIIILLAKGLPIVFKNLL